MKAGVHVVLFLATVYDYFFGKGKENTDQYGEPQPDQPYHQDIENDSDGYYNANSLIRKFKSFQQPKNSNRSSLFDFDQDEQEEQENRNNQGGVYTRLANDELEKWSREKQQEGIVRGTMDKIWSGTTDIMNKYAKRRTELNRKTIESSAVLTGVQDKLAQASEVVQMKYSKYMHARRAVNGIRNTFGDDFVTL